MIPKVCNYINPFSSDFKNSVIEFRFLSKGRQFVTIALSIVAGLSTIWLLGIGGYATFHALVDRFKPMRQGDCSTTDKTSYKFKKMFPKKNDRRDRALLKNALVDALLGGDFSFGKKLLEEGADVNGRPFRGFSVHKALLNRMLVSWDQIEEFEKKEAKELLYAILDKTEGKVPNIDALFETACSIGDLEVIKALVKKGASYKGQEGGIDAAIRSGSIDVVRYLSNKGLRLKNDPSSTSLTDAFYCKNRGKRLEVIKFLLQEKKLNPNVYASYGSLIGSPLHAAIHERDLDLVKLLIECGADVNFAVIEVIGYRISDGFIAPLDKAERCGFLEIAELLKKHGAKKAAPRPFPEAPQKTSTKEDYETLGLKEGASWEEIKTAYVGLALKYHPDKSKAAGTEENFKKIGTAYANLAVKFGKK